MDVSKAFNKVWHNGLVAKLESLGIAGCLLAFLGDYLSERKQRVRLRGTLSLWLLTLAGVPQGSILGPLLYLIYTTDVAGLVECVIRLFADDTTMMSIAPTAAECVEKLQPSIDRVMDLAKDLTITMNPDKTKVMIISRLAFDYKLVMMSGLYVEEVLNHRHLGLTLQGYGKWRLHTSGIIEKTEGRLCIPKSYSKSLGRRALKQLYLSYVAANSGIFINSLDEYNTGRRRASRSHPKISPQYYNRSQTGQGTPGPLCRA